MFQTVSRLPGLKTSETLEIKGVVRNTNIAEFEGLRGLLAAWVVFGHILLFAGFSYQDGWFGVVFSPVLGVYVFMMLSGFVITATLDQRPDTWIRFMTRRFFRIFPVYVLCILLAIALFDVSASVSRLGNSGIFGKETLQRLSDVDQNFGLYLFADSTLLQSLLPHTLYPSASETFLPPTWSLSIEWLFYIVAPFLIWGITRFRTITSGIFGVGLLAIWFFQPQLTTINPSFHLGNAFHFLTGIISYYLWKHFPERKFGWIPVFCFWMTVIAGITLLNLPYKMWFAMMALILYGRVHHRRLSVLEWSRNILNSRPLLFLGRTSYVTYLLHWIVIEIVLFWLFHFVPDLTDKYLLVAICVIIVYPVTYLASDLVNRYFERPMMLLPKRRRTRQISLNGLGLAPGRVLQTTR